jgi:hypothetical protein
MVTLPKFSLNMVNLAKISLATINIITYKINNVGSW